MIGLLFFGIEGPTLRILARLISETILRHSSACYPSNSRIYDRTLRTATRYIQSRIT